MTGSHSDIGPELRQLAMTILDRLDPAVRLAAARAAGTGDGQGRCRQVWCPFCALAALAAGEQHPLLDVIAEHSVALLAVVRAIIENGAGQPQGPTGPGEPPPDTPPEGPGDGEPSSNGPGRYQHIPVTVEE